MSVIGKCAAEMGVTASDLSVRVDVENGRRDG